VAAAQPLTGTLFTLGKILKVPGKVQRPALATVMPDESRASS
jgi:fatty acid/phospholipid biosynthesis enzyme